MDITELSKQYDFTGKTVVLTGGTGVLGREMASGLVGLGAKVAVLDRNTEIPEDYQTKVEAGPGKYLVVSGDVLDRSRLEDARELIVSAFGQINCLINAAGGNHPAATTKPEQVFSDLPEDALQFTLDLNLLGTILPCQVFGKEMIKHQSGSIVNITSMAAERPLTRIPAYAAAKAGVSNFTRWLAVHMAQEYSPEIRVNALAPGFFLTSQNRFLLMEEDEKTLTARGRQIISHTPLARFGMPEDLLGTLFWLLSDASRFVTGIIVPVDGGFSAYSGV
ncbi:MAG: SDR family oxidoreductase [Anaerolineales bacterium]|nr:SDR family oxidoreductase [Anaerolineales bacterium]